MISKTQQNRCPICKKAATDSDTMIARRRRNNWFCLEGYDYRGYDFIFCCDDCYWRDWFLLEAYNFGEAYFAKISWDYMKDWSDSEHFMEHISHSPEAPYLGERGRD